MRFFLKSIDFFIHIMYNVKWRCTPIKLIDDQKFACKASCNRNFVVFFTELDLFQKIRKISQT